MGLNMNYKFFLEGYNSHCHIPDYINYNNCVNVEEFTLQNTLKFNNTLRESVQNIVSINESEEPGDIQFSQIYDSLTTAKEAISTVKNSLLEEISGAKETIESCKTREKNPIEYKYSISQRIEFIKRMIVIADPAELQIHNIGEITAGNVILDKMFPNISAIKGITTENTDFNSFKDNILYNMLGSFYDPSKAANTMSFAVGIADTLMPDRKYTQRFLLDTYIRAYSNLNSIDTVIELLDYMKADVESSFNNCLHKIDEYINNLENNGSNEYKNIYGHRSASLINVIQNVICVANIVASRKIHRLIDIYGYGKDSITVINTAHELILKYCDLSENTDKPVEDVAQDTPADSISFNGEDSVKEFYDIQHDNTMTNMLIENVYNEYKFECMLEQYLTELTREEWDAQSNEPTIGRPEDSSSKSDGKAEESKPQENQNKDSNNSNNNDSNNNKENNSKSKNKFGILNWLKQIISRLGEAIGRFKQRIDEVLGKGGDKQFWEDNKNKLKNINIMDTQVNQWYCYNLNLFKNSTVIKFDPVSKDLQSDDAMENAALNKIHGTTGTDYKATAGKDKDDSFLTRVNKAYQGAYINIDNSKGKTLANIRYNFDEAFKYVDEFVYKGYSSDALGTINDDYKQIDEDYKNASRNYNDYMVKMRNNPSNDTNNQATQQQPSSGEPKSETGSQKPAQQQTGHESAISDFNSGFNLAECLGLSQIDDELPFNEAEITPGEKTTEDAEKATGKVDDNNSKTLDDAIHRCFSTNISVITAKCTNAFAAYKQNMNLFKTVIKASSKNEKKQEKNNKKNNGNQENNQNQENNNQPNNEGEKK
jgi:hypothetical protein|nr:MAG TPA: hypothetical protein [Caudoviricetes sp.]